MNIEINMDSVVIEKQVVKRPDYIGRMYWQEYWESILDTKKLWCPRCGVTVRK